MIDINTDTGTIVVNRLYSVDFRGSLTDFTISNDAWKDSHACINVGHSKDELWARQRCRNYVQLRGETNEKNR